MKECKRCLLRESAEEDVYKDIRARIVKLPPRDRTDEDTYGRRLEACRSCDHLISGICMKCGCYVEFRAAFSKMKCPNVKDRKW